MKKGWILYALIALTSTVVCAQQPHQRICLIGEYHCFLRNYLPENAVIRSVEGPKIILFENEVRYNTLLHAEHLCSDSTRFLDGMNTNRGGKMRELMHMVCNNYYQVICANSGALVSFIDTRYTCATNILPFKPINRDSARALIKSRYKHIFRAEHVAFRDWAYLLDDRCMQGWDVYARDLEVRLRSGKLSDRQKMAVFHFFQENRMLCHEGMEAGAPSRDSLFFKQIVLLTRIFPQHSIVSIHGARHTYKPGGKLYRFLSDAGMKPEVYSILYDQFDDINVEQEDMISRPEDEFTKGMNRQQLSIMDVRNCTDCSADYTVYFHQPEGILGFLHFFEFD
jgi:hypothetical protein